MTSKPSKLWMELMIRWEIVFPTVANAATLVTRWRRTTCGSCEMIPIEVARSTHPGSRTASLRSRRMRSRNRAIRSDQVLLKRDDFSSNRHHALAYCLSMIFSEHRYPLFRIILYGRHYPYPSHCTSAL